MGAFLMLRRLLFTLLSLGLATGLAHAQTKPTLTVYTYSSFAGKYGPGKTIKERFEAVCACELVWVTSEDAGSMVGRLRLEGEGTKADAVVGLDMNLAAEAKALGLFAPHGADVKDLSLPIQWADDTFIPFDWGYLAFVYDSKKLANPPKSLKELVENPNGPKVVLQDPRTSAPGLGFLLWMQTVYGDRAGEAWEQLKPRIVTFTKGWSEAYGLFMKGEADMVMSYIHHVTGLSRRGGEEGQLQGRVLRRRPLPACGARWDDPHHEAAGSGEEVYGLRAERAIPVGDT
jgi:thiamine transport system substrate-binding protein